LEELAAVFPHVVQLGVSTACVRDGGARVLQSFRELECLSVAGDFLRSDIPITDENMGLFASLSSLKDLNLCNTQVTVDGLARLVALPDLESLRLVDVLGLSDQAVPVLLTFPKLKQLSILGVRELPGLTLEGATTLEAHGIGVNPNEPKGKEYQFRKKDGTGPLRRRGRT
jgi:hypothetical protein